MKFEITSKPSRNFGIKRPTRSRYAENKEINHSDSLTEIVAYMAVHEE